MRSAYYVERETGEINEGSVKEFKAKCNKFVEKFGKDLTYNLKEGYPSASSLNSYMEALNDFNKVFTDDLATETPEKCKSMVQHGEGIAELTNIFEKINQEAEDNDTIQKEKQDEGIASKDAYTLDPKFNKYEKSHHAALIKIYTSSGAGTKSFPFDNFYNAVNEANLDKFNEASITSGTEKDYHKLKGQWTSKIIDCLLRLDKMTNALEQHRTSLTKVKDILDNSANKAKTFKKNVKHALNIHVAHVKPHFEVLKVCDTIVGKQFIFLDKFVNSYHSQMKAQAIASQNATNNENKSTESLIQTTERYNLYDEFNEKVKRAESVSSIYDNLATLSAVSNKYGYTKSMEALVGKEIDKFAASAPSTEALSTLMIVVITVLVAAILAVVVFVIYKLFKKGGAGSEACKALVEKVKEMTGWINK